MATKRAGKKRGLKPGHKKSDAWKKAISVAMLKSWATGKMKRRRKRSKTTTTRRRKKDYWIA